MKRWGRAEAAHARWGSCHREDSRAKALRQGHPQWGTEWGGGQWEGQHVLGAWWVLKGTGDADVGAPAGLSMEGSCAPKQVCRKQEGRWQAVPGTQVSDNGG